MRTFHRHDAAQDEAAFEREIASLRKAESELAQRSATQVEDDRRRIAASIAHIAGNLPART